MNDPIDMNAIEDLFRRQAEWQKSRARLTWSEKLALAEVLRDAALAMRRSGRPSDPKRG